MPVAVVRKVRENLYDVPESLPFRGFHLPGVDTTFSPILGYGDGRKIIEGETLSMPYEPTVCFRGLHAAPSIASALLYRHQPEHVCLVEVWGLVAIGEDKVSGQHRKCVKLIHTARFAERLMAEIGAKNLVYYSQMLEDCSRTNWYALRHQDADITHERICRHAINLLKEYGEVPFLWSVYERLIAPSDFTGMVMRSESRRLAYKNGLSIHQG